MNSLLTKIVSSKESIESKSLILGFMSCFICLVGFSIDQVYPFMQSEYVGYLLATSLVFFTVSKFTQKVRTPLENDIKKLEFEKKIHKYLGTSYIIFDAEQKTVRNTCSERYLKNVDSKQELLSSFRTIKANQFQYIKNGEKLNFKQHSMGSFEIIEFKNLYTDQYDSNKFFYSDFFYEQWVELFASDTSYKNKIHFRCGENLEVNIGIEEIERLKKIVNSIYLLTQKIKFSESVQVSIKTSGRDLNVQFKYIGIDSSLQQLGEVHFSSPEDSLFKRFSDFERSFHKSNEFTVGLSKQVYSSSANTLIDIGIFDRQHSTN